MSNKEEMILSTDPRAAELKTVQLWVSRNGGHYKEEEYARYDGCTHRPCTRCGEPAERAYIACAKCRAISADENYMKMELKEWDGAGMLYSEELEQYFSSAEDIEDHLEREALYGQRNLKLVICEPEYPHEIDGTEHFVDQLPEGFNLDDVAPKLSAALDEVNRVIREEKEILCLMPGKFRTDLEIKYPIKPLCDVCGKDCAPDELDIPCHLRAGEGK